MWSVGVDDGWVWGEWVSNIYTNPNEGWKGVWNLRGEGKEGRNL